MTTVNNLGIMWLKQLLKVLKITNYDKQSTATP